VAVRLEAALGCALASPIAALTDLPPFDSAAMDGYAVAGSSPWLLSDADLRAGSEALTRLDSGTAVAIATGAALPFGCDAVLRTEQAGIETALHGNRLFPLDPLTGLPDDSGSSLPPGTDVRRRCSAWQRRLATTRSTSSLRRPWRCLCSAMSYSSEACPGPVACAMP
jgi:molybdopterin molybdotransferase